MAKRFALEPWQSLLCFKGLRCLSLDSSDLLLQELLGSFSSATEELSLLMFSRACCWINGPCCWINGPCGWINENEKRGLNYDPTLNWSIEGKLVGGDNTIQQLRPYLMSDGRQAAQNQPGNSKQSNLHCAKEQTAAAQGQQSSPKYTHKMAQIAQIYY